MSRLKLLAAGTVTALVMMGSTGCVLTGASGTQYRIGTGGIQEIPPEERVAATPRPGQQTLKHAREAPDPMQTFEMTTQWDVDTAYARIRNHFGFQTLVERAGRDERQQQWVALDRGYHHRATPGVQYSLRQYRVRNVDGYQDPLQIDIDREGQGARLHVQFYADTAPGGSEAFAHHLRSELAEALR
jgi:hypothetical protein